MYPRFHSPGNSRHSYIFLMVFGSPGHSKESCICILNFYKMKMWQQLRKFFWVSMACNCVPIVFYLWLFTVDLLSHWLLKMCLEYSSQDHGILNPLCAQDYFSPRRLTSTSHNFKFLDECSIMSCNPDFIRNHFAFFHAFSRNCLHFVSLTRFVNISLYPCKRSFGRYIGNVYLFVDIILKMSLPFYLI